MANLFIFFNLFINYSFKKKIIPSDANIYQLIKVNNFFISWGITILYICFYVWFVLVLRILQLGAPVDLKKYFNLLFGKIELIAQYSLYNKLIVILFLIIFLLLWVLIFLKLQKYMVNHIWKLSFYYANIERTFPWSARPKGFWFWSFMRTISYSEFCFRCFYYLFPSFKWLKGDHYYLMHFLFSLLPSLFLIIVFILELLLNNFVIYYIFYYLLIYMLIMIWVRGTRGVWDYSSDFGAYTKTIIEIVYGAPKILYVNILEAEENSLKEFLKNPIRKGYWYDYPEFKEHPLFRCDIFLQFANEDQFLPIDVNRRFENKYVKKKEDPTGMYRDENEIERIGEEFVYENKLTSKYFHPVELVKIGDYLFVDDPQDLEAMQEMQKRIAAYLKKRN